MVDFMRDHLLRQGLISEDDFHLFSVTESVDAAVEEIEQFYSNYHSSRWVGQQLVLRLQKALTPSALDRISGEFSDLLQGEKIVQRGALEIEANEPLLAEMPRLVLSPHRRNFGRLRLLINAVNAAELA